MKRKILSVILSFAMVLSLLPSMTLTASAADEDVIEISDAAGLAAFRDRVNDGETGLNAMLTADINLGGSASNQWTPIGDSDAVAYAGTFDGGGHLISGLYGNLDRVDYGLFSHLASEGAVKNVGVSGYFKSYMSTIGGIVAHNSGTIQNCYNDCTISSSSSTVGGIAGRNNTSGKIENCYNTGLIDNSGESAGGIAGNNNGTIETCYNTGSVSGGPDSVNGYSGQNKCGGIAGKNNGSGTITDCYNSGTVKSTGGEIGGVVGYRENGSTVKDSYYVEDTVSGSSVNSTDNSALPENELANHFNGNGWTYSPLLGRPVLTSNPEGGLGSEEYPYEIPNLTTLIWFRNYVNETDAGISGKLTDDITMDNTSWTPIGNDESHSFTGTFDGGGHSISGLHISSTSEGCYGLFGYVGSGGTVKGVDLKDSSIEVSITGASNTTYYIHAGSIAAVNDGTVEDCHTTTTSTNSTYSIRVSITFFINNSTISNATAIYAYGGIVGKNTGLVQNCYNTGNGSGGYGLSGYNLTISCHAGGVAGENTGTVTGCYNTGSVSGSGYNSDGYVGGVAGYVSGTVESSYSTGSVWSSDGYAGGVAGYVSGGTVENCYNTGEVDSGYAGGVAGYNDGGTVTNCYNTSRIRSTSPSTFYGGGVVAYNAGTVTNCYNDGEMSMDMPSIVYGGGVVGYNAGTVTNCYNTGGMSMDMTSTFYGGGVVGYNTGTVTNCYNTGMVPSRAWASTLYAGGVVGYNTGGRVENCYNIGPIQNNGRQISCAGGVVGQNDNGGTVTNCYYLNTCAAEDVTFTNTEGESKTAAQFASGEVAWLLQNGQTNNTTQVWGQTVGTDIPLLSSSKIGKGVPRVYKVVFTGDNVSLDPIYTNGGKVTEPTGPAVPDDEGEWIFGWYADGGTQWDFDVDTVTGDVSLTARWTRVYAITVEEAENGTVTASPDKAAEGETVTLTVKPDDGYQLKALTVTAQDRTLITVVDDNTFVMPASDVTVKAEFEKKTEAGGDDRPTPTPTPGKPGGSGNDGTPGPSSSSPANSVTVSNPDAANGTVRSDVSSAKAGDTVSVSSAADRGYISAAPVVTDKNGNAVPVTKNADGTYSFTMPEGGVTVTGSYVTPGQLFSDVSDSAWYRNDLAYVVENGLMTGYGKGKFAPGDELSRAMLAQILYNAEDRPGIDGDESFTDVSSSAWHADAIAWAAANGIVTGYGNGLYGPEDPITREQLAVMLWRYAGETAVESDLTAFADAGKISAWAADAMAWAVSNGIIEGKGNGILDPKGQATRAETAAMFMRFLTL